MTRKIVLLVTIIVIAITPVFAQGQKPKDMLVIAISLDFQPFTFLNAESQPAGMFVDIWRLWAKKTGTKIKFVSSDRETSLENLENHKADMHSGLFYSQERSNWLSVSLPFYETRVSLFFPLKHSMIADINELSHRE